MIDLELERVRLYLLALSD